MKGTVLKKSTAYGLLFSGLALSACSPMKSGSGAANTGIVNGTTAVVGDTAAGGVAESVVIIIAKLPSDDPNKTMEAMCTGTLIAPQVVLTAGHCTPAGVQAKNMRVGLHFLDVNNPQTKPADAKGFNVKALVKFPGFNENSPDSIQQDDLALLLLDQPVPAGTRIAALPDSLSDSANLTGVTAIGYGQSDERHSADPENNGAGTLRYVTFPVDNEHFGVLPPNGSDGQPDKAGNMFVVLSGTTAVCHGDSGGPLMAQIDGKTSDTIVGVNDAVLADYADPSEKAAWHSALESGSEQAIAGFYKKYPDAGICSGGQNLFVNVLPQLPWIRQTQAQLLAGKGQTSVPADSTAQARN